MNERNEVKIRLLTGCSGFGDYDPMNGSCVDCSINNEKQWTKCREFKEKTLCTVSIHNVYGT